MCVDVNDAQHTHWQAIGSEAIRACTKHKQKVCEAIWMSILEHPFLAKQQGMDGVYRHAAEVPKRPSSTIQPVAEIS